MCTVEDKMVNMRLFMSQFLHNVMSSELQYYMK